MADRVARTLLARPAEGPLAGEFRPPGDKSISHRALILSLMAQGQSEISGLLISEDVKATAHACRQLGAVQHASGSKLVVEGAGKVGLTAPADPLDMGNSGTAIRLLAGALSTQRFDSVLIGDQSLSRRPMSRIVKPLSQMGAEIKTTGRGTPPLRIRGGRLIRGIRYRSPVASAQVKSCILLAGLGASGETEVLEPYPSRDHTERMLEAFGAGNGGLPRVRGGTVLHGAQVTVPADLSSAAFFLVGASLVPESHLVLKAVGLNPTRDGLIEVMNRMGASIVFENERTQGGEPIADIIVRWRRGMKAVEIGGKLIPRLIDELPVIMVAASMAEGMTRIRNAGELRVKESDRISVMAKGLRRAGIVVREYTDGIDIEGGIPSECSDEPIELEAKGDHRCAMSLCILALALGRPLRIRGAENINTSYPGFLPDLTNVGARVVQEEWTEDG